MWVSGSAAKIQRSLGGTYQSIQSIGNQDFVEILLLSFCREATFLKAVTWIRNNS